MLFLHHGSTSVCAIKVRLALAEKGLPWEGRVLDGEITPQETQDLRFMYQNYVVG